MVRHLLKYTITGGGLSLPVKGYSVPLEITSVQRLTLVEREDWTSIFSGAQNLPTPKAFVCRLPGKELSLHQSRKYPVILMELRSNLLFRISWGFDRCQLDADAADP